METRRLFLILDEIAKDSTACAKETEIEKTPWNILCNFSKLIISLIMRSFPDNLIISAILHKDERISNK